MGEQGMIVLVLGIPFGLIAAIAAGFKSRARPLWRFVIICTAFLVGLLVPTLVILAITWSVMFLWPVGT
jgi:hypothetical protein